MYCANCNVDFEAPLRYCKFCGSQLAERTWVTSELLTCKECGATIDPSWSFCKSCGTKLPGATDPGLSQPAAQAPSAQPLTECPVCGEHLDAATTYCKGCGSLVAGSAGVVDTASLLCRACNSYSPAGSSACHACGAQLHTPTTMGRPAPEFDEARSEARTLLDLSEGAPSNHLHTRVDTGEMGSSNAGEEFTDVSTRVFDSSDGVKTRMVEALDPSTHGISGPETGRPPLRPSGGADTSVLPGVAGSEREESPPTALISQGRDTGAVETDQFGGKPQEASVAPPEATESLVVSEIPLSQAEELTADTEHKTGEIASGIEPGFSSEPTRAFIAPVEAETRAIETPLPPVEPAAPVAQEPTVRVTSAVQSQEVAETRQIPRPVIPEVAQQIAETGQLPAARSKAGLVAGISVAVVLVILLAAGYLLWTYVVGGPRSKPATEEITAAPEVVAPAEPPAPIPPDGMVLVPGGAYMIGSDNRDDYEKPEHQVELEAFFIDRTEVTNAAYKSFVDATGRAAPSTWVNGEIPEGQENYPVVEVAWLDAAEYARWAGKRLPREVEWEAAARGSEGLIYPWGNEWRSGLANIATKSFAPVGKFADGASPFGVVDMIGNVWEWAADEFNVYPGSTVPMPSTMDPRVTYRVIRGGAYDGNNSNTATYRGFLDESKPFPRVGFRCAKDVDRQ